MRSFLNHSLFFTTLSTLFFFSQSLKATENESFNIEKPFIVKSQNKEYSRQRLRDYFSDIPEFNYFGSQSIGSNASVFMYGLDQRYFEIKYNGHKLQDPTTPLGTLEVSSLSRLSGMKVTKSSNNQSFNVVNDVVDTSLNGQVTSLKETALDGFYKINKNIYVKSGFSRLGGFNQTHIGSEKDWTQEFFISPTINTKINEYQLVTDFLYTYKDQDFDSFLSNEEDSNGLSHYLFIGQTVKNKKRKFKTSLTKVDKSFNEGLGFESFDIKANVLNAEYEYDKSIKLRAQFEKNDELEDSKVEASFEKRNFGLYFVSSKLRGDFYSVDLKPLKNVTVFYKEIEPSLFQISFNDNDGLKKQKALGLKFENNFIIKQLDFKVQLLYQRAFDQVEYNFLNNSYANFQRVENGFFNIMSQWKSLGAYAQLQRAENLETHQALPRRSPLSFGLDYEFNFLGFLSHLNLAWHSKRRAFDNTKLSDFMTSRLSFERKRVRIVVTNVLNQDNEIYKNFKRRPVAIELNYLYKF